MPTGRRKAPPDDKLTPTLSAQAGRGSHRAPLDRLLPRCFDTPLPIDAVLDDLSRTLRGHNAAVLVAPPGAGKTTRVPLVLLDAPWAKDKKIIVLEPRRIAARASARPRSASSERS